MNSLPPRPPVGRFTIDPLARVSSVTLAARDLDAAVRFYVDIIGLKMLKRSPRTASLGVDTSPVVMLEAGAMGKPPSRATGLFHLAILLPSRAHLGQWLVHLTERGYPLDGAGDHLVSEALYLSDPEGNGVEVYSDRPRDTWQYDPRGLKMDTLPVDLNALLRDASAEPFRGLPEETTLGHIHLKVDDVSNAISFYRDLLGFDLTATFPGAGFLSAGGYHHHIGVNAWQSRGGAPAPSDSTGLVSFNIRLPSEAARRAVVGQLTSADYAIEETGGSYFVRDAAGNRIALSLD
jgi:catechol 2,3-dioxygenase